CLIHIVHPALLSVVLRRASLAGYPFALLSHRLFFASSAPHPDLPSFPTRRSSDPRRRETPPHRVGRQSEAPGQGIPQRLSPLGEDRKSTRLNSSHGSISYAVFCLKKKNKKHKDSRTSQHI